MDIGIMLWIVLLIIVVAWGMKWKLKATVLIYYIMRKQYTPPSKKEMEVCTEEVIRHMVKDLISRK